MVTVAMFNFIDQVDTIVPGSIMCGLGLHNIGKIIIKFCLVSQIPQPPWYLYCAIYKIYSLELECAQYGSN